MMGQRDALKSIVPVMRGGLPLRKSKRTLVWFMIVCTLLTMTAVPAFASRGHHRVNNGCGCCCGCCACGCCGNCERYWDGCWRWNEDDQEDGWDDGRLHRRWQEYDYTPWEDEVEADDDVVTSKPAAWPEDAEKPNPAAWLEEAEKPAEPAAKTEEAEKAEKPQLAAKPETAEKVQAAAQEEKGPAEPNAAAPEKPEAPEEPIHKESLFDWLHAVFSR